MTWKAWLATVLLLLTPHGIAQVVDQRVTDADGREMLLGRLSRQALASSPFSRWYSPGLAAYVPDEQVLRRLDLTGHEISVFLGTWCGDSQREVPRLLKTLDALDYPAAGLTLIGVNRARQQYKQSPNGEQEGKNIHRVPTVIVYRNGTEVGRIIESPVSSMEQDLLAITSGRAYTPNYRVVERLNALLLARGSAVVAEDAPAVARELKPASLHSGELRGFGYARLFQGELEDALAIFEVNRALFPQEAVVYEGLAQVHLEQGNDAQAVAAAQRTLELQPGSKRARDVLRTLGITP